jgi:drug/metabolite transporter (DMT)-like permease
VTYFLSAFSGRESLNYLKLFAVFLLIFGGLLISFELPLKINKKKFFSGFYWAILAGFLLGVSYVLFKEVYISQPFYSGFVWTRMGVFMGACLFLLVPLWRKDILKSFKTGKKAPKKQYKTGGLFIFNKILGGTSSILLNKAIAMGSVTAVNAMISVQYVFVIVIAFFVSKKQQKIFGEKMGAWDWAQKISAIFIIALGMYFLS